MVWRRLRSGIIIPEAATITRSYGSTGEDAGNTASPNYGTLTAPDSGTRSHLLAVITVANSNLNNGVATCTIGGASATMLHEYDNRPGGADGGTISFWYIADTTGTTETVTATLDFATGNNRGSACALYSIVGLSGAPTVHASTDNSDNNVNDTVELDVEIPAGGICFGGSYNNLSGTVTWAGLTEDGEIAVGNNSHICSTASLESATTQTPTITAAASAASLMVGSVISIGP